MIKRTQLIIERLIPNKGDRVQIMPIGDAHLGAKTYKGDLLKELIQFCVKKKIYVIGMGDMIEFATKYSIGAGIYEQQLNPQRQVETIIKLFEPLQEAGLLLGMLTGNHEDRCTKETGINIMKIMCNALHCKYLGSSGYLLLKVGSESYTVFATHGSTGGRTYQGKMSGAIKCFGYNNVEIVLYGHTHGLGYNKLEYFSINKKNKTVKKKPKYAVLTGSFLDYYGSYAEKKNYLPATPGTSIISLYGDSHKIFVSV